jgi:hypothetical protein
VAVQVARLWSALLSGEAFWWLPSLLYFLGTREARLKMDQGIGLRMEMVSVRYSVNFRSILGINLLLEIA